MTHEIPNCAEFFAERARKQQQQIERDTGSLRAQFCERLEKTKPVDGKIVVDVTYNITCEPCAINAFMADAAAKGWSVVDLGWKQDRKIGTDARGILQVTGSPPHVGDYDASLRRLLRAES